MDTLPIAQILIIKSLEDTIARYYRKISSIRIQPRTSLLRSILLLWRIMDSFLSRNVIRVIYNVFRICYNSRNIRRFSSQRVLRPDFCRTSDNTAPIPNKCVTGKPLKHNYCEFTKQSRET